LSTPEPRRQFTDTEKATIRRSCVPSDTTDDEFNLLIAYAERTGLDPITRQIYLPQARLSHGKRVPPKPQATIDGFRVVAERSGQYAGQVGPEWCGEDGAWKDIWTNKNAMPYAARVGVLRSGFQAPIYAVAEFEAYAQYGQQGLNPMWKKLGSHMIAKCAEALALRKAFPQDLSGLYTADEMAQATPYDAKDETPEGGQAEEPRAPRPSVDRNALVQQAAHGLGELGLLDKATDILLARFNVRKSGDLSDTQVATFAELVKTVVGKPKELALKVLLGQQALPSNAPQVPPEGTEASFPPATIVPPTKITGRSQALAFLDALPLAEIDWEVVLMARGAGVTKVGGLDTKDVIALAKEAQVFVLDQGGEIKTGAIVDALGRKAKGDAA